MNYSPDGADILVAQRRDKGDSRNWVEKKRNVVLRNINRKNRIKRK
jgi:hypothetical protein